MLLTIDVGNTNLTLGLYQGDKLEHHWRLATDHDRMPDEYGLQFLGVLEHVSHPVEALSGISLASVVPQRLAATTNIWFSMARAWSSTRQWATRAAGHWAATRRMLAP